MKKQYLTCCVTSTAELIDDMITKAREITCRTFLRNVDIDIEHFGYTKKGKGLKLQNDYHVRFYKSIFDNMPCYYMVHSAIEYIFT